MAQHALGLDPGVAADDGADQVRQQHQRGDVEAGLPLDFAPNFTRALDYDGAFQSWPIVALLQPSDIVDHCISSGFDAAMIAIDGLMAANLCVLKTVGLLLRGEQLNILAQSTLIAFERQNVIGLFVYDFLGDFALAAHRIGKVSACRSR